MTGIGWASFFSIVLIAIAVCAVFAFYARRAGLAPGQRDGFVVAFVVGLLGWLLLAAVLAGVGVFQASASRPFPTIALGLGLATVAGIILLSRSAALNAVVDAVPLPWLVGIQLYRVVGFIFLLLYGLAQLPGEFALPAGVGDVLIGLTAPVVAYALHRRYLWSDAAAFVWNVAGIADLVIAVGTGFLSSPGPLQMLALDNPNYLVTAFPFVLVPLFAVPLSILLHLAALKRQSRIGGGRLSTRILMEGTHSRRRVVSTLVIAGVLLATPTAAQVETLRLTLDDAVRRAVENNPELAIVKLGTEVEAARVGESLSAFTPVFSTLLGRSSSVTPPSNLLLGERGVDIDDWFSSTGVRQRLPWGSGTWSVSWETSRTATNNPISSFDPSLQSGFQLAFSQPLLKDRSIDSARQQYTIAKRNQDSSDLHFREAVVQTVAAVKQAYWTLRATQANVAVQQRSLELAQELARENRVRVDAGQIPPLDLVQAEAEVAQRRENLIRANTVAEDAEDALRRLIVDPADVAFWRVRIDPVEEPTSIGAPPDVDGAVAKALDERYDLARAGHELANTQTTIDFLANQRLPDVRLETSYRGSGLSGTQFLRSGGFPGLVTGTRNRNFGDALGQVFTSDYPTWSLGLTVSYPLGRSFEAASFARAQVERRQAAQRIASLRVQAAETVRRAGRQVQSTAERVQAARAVATLAQERLESERRRFEVGSSTTFLVTQAQRDLLEAQVNLLQTTLEYESALVNFEAVQQAPPLAAGDTVGIRGAAVVQLQTPVPRGIFRPGTGVGF
ncbi:MAG: TolC family protein [Vicinamibacterales bacterium]